MSKNMIAIVFNTNIDLINDWRFERKFSLHFYGGLKKQENEYKIEIGKMRRLGLKRIKNFFEL